MCCIYLSFLSVCVLVYFFCSTAAATFRQAVALIFDHVVSAESLPAGKFGFGGQLPRTTSVTGDVNRSINLSKYVLPLVIRDLLINGVVSSIPIILRI